MKAIMASLSMCVHLVPGRGKLCSSRNQMSSKTQRWGQSLAYRGGGRNINNVDSNVNYTTTVLCEKYEIQGLSGVKTTPIMTPLPVISTFFALNQLFAYNNTSNNTDVFNTKS